MMNLEYIVQLLNDSGIDKIKNQLSLNSYFRFHKKETDIDFL